MEFKVVFAEGKAVEVLGFRTVYVTFLPFVAHIWKKII